MPEIAIVGLGYVGLPLAAALARVHPSTVGFDVDREKIHRLRERRDLPAGLRLTSDLADLRPCDFYVVAVPTPIDSHHRPDLSFLEAASRQVGSVLSPGDVVVYESTVYPGVTEEVCGPLLEAASGLRSGVDFKLGYSPERINPGDPEHGLERVVKVVSGQDAETLERVAAVYESVVEAGVYRARSIQVAEAAKVIENVQRDLNIALMNELAVIFDRLGLDTHEVLDAAATKWNFHRFHPGLVGGHCIGVDPYYLTSKAESVGIHPQVILAGRRINDGMGTFVASKTVKLLIAAHRNVNGARVAVLGMAFKPNLSDIRNSRVPDIVRELCDYGVHVLAHDPLADPAEVAAEYGIELVEEPELRALDAVVLAIPHRELVGLAPSLVERKSGEREIPIVDVMAGLRRAALPPGVLYWRL